MSTDVPNHPTEQPDVAPGQPKISDDGKFYWDGQHWVPLPQPARPTHAVVAAASARFSRLPGGLVLASGVLIAISPFLPWLTATAPFVGSISRSLIDGIDGQVLAVLGVVAGLVGLAMLVRGPNRGLGVLALLLFAASIWLAWVDFADVEGRITNLTSSTSEFRIIADPGPGPFLGFLAAGLGIVGGLIALLRGQIEAVEHGPGAEEASAV